MNLRSIARGVVHRRGWRCAAPFVIIGIHGSRRVEQDLVSVIIPCYQHGALLSAAVQSALDQTHPRVEAIIVDDGSTDATAQTAEALAARHRERVFVRHQSNQGQAAARQNGLGLAHGTYVIFLDADDLLEPEMAARAMEIFRRHPRTHAVVGDARCVDAENRRVLRDVPQARVCRWPRVLERNPYGMMSAVVLRREGLDRIGGVRAGVGDGAEDWDLWARMIRCGFVFHPIRRPLARYRQIAGSHSHAPLAGLEPYLRLLEYAAQTDPRLAAAPGPAGPPISVREQSIYRNARVFFHLGKAWGTGAEPAAWQAILAYLHPGALDVRRSSDQFLEGLQWTLSAAAEPAGRTEEDRQELLDALGLALGSCAMEKDPAPLLSAIQCSLRKPWRKRSIAARVQDRWERQGRLL